MLLQKQTNSERINERPLGFIQKQLFDLPVLKNLLRLFVGRCFNHELVSKGFSGIEIQVGEIFNRRNPSVPGVSAKPLPITIRIFLKMKKLPFKNSTYQTSPRRISWFSQAFPELSLYSRFLQIVFAASAKAKQGKYNDEDWCKSSMASLGALENIGVMIQITGMNHIESLDRPCVVIGNHMSLMEALILPIIIQPVRRVTFIVKQSLLDYPVFGHIMRARDPIALTRTNPRQDLKTVLEAGLERLKRGVSIIVFPQTTRMHRFDPGQFSTMGVKLALKANVPIVPLALKTDAWGNGKYLKDFGRIDPTKPVHFAFDKPIRVTGRGVEEHKVIIQFISKKLTEWGVKP